MHASSTRPLLIWDLPTRLFHWLLVISIVGCFVTIKAGGLWMDWHVRFGLLALGLLAFRLIWGLVGGYYSRFSHFLPNPSRSLRYLRDKPNLYPGHNPVGAWSVWIMLIVFGFQAVSGLFANDDIFTAGPLAYLSSDWSKTLTGLHKANEGVMLAIIGLHVLAIFLYRVLRGQKLTSVMVKGTMPVPAQAPLPASTDTWKTRLLALIIAALIAAGVYWLTGLAPTGGGMDDFM
ncbi:cytochrome b/b6 domain-containing protein [Alcaligenes sp. Lyrl_28]|uniref:cytochrome b/b6 domain-containing protein n=1 Tax=Alcaligenes sp. Lyrl_28 TaxID=3110924 RepID=UPI003F7BD29C